jgi:hypothetical protein
MRLSVARLIQRRMVGLVYNKLDMMLREVVVAKSSYYSGIILD